MVTFKPSVWKAQGEAVNRAAETFYRACQPVIVQRAFAPHNNSAIEAALINGELDKCYDTWHTLIAAAEEAISNLGSKMVGAGSDYAENEEAAAAASKRFFDVPR